MQLALHLALKPKESQFSVLRIQRQESVLEPPATPEELILMRFTDVGRAAPRIGARLPEFGSWTVQKEGSELCPNIRGSLAFCCGYDVTSCLGLLWI